MTGVAAGLELHGRLEVVEGDPVGGARRGAQPGGGRGAGGGAARGRGRAAGGRRAGVAGGQGCGGVRRRRWAPALAGVVATEIPRERLAEAGRPGAAGAWRRRLGRGGARGGVGWVEEVAEPAAAVERARSVAAAQGGVALVTGSHYLLRYAEWRANSAAADKLVAQRRRRWRNSLTSRLSQSVWSLVQPWRSLK